MTFQDLGVIAPILKALSTEGYTSPTPIQQQAIPVLLRGKDLLGCAQTGTGKTCAFAVPILQHLYKNRPDRNAHKKISALIVTPTRELAIQIGDSFKTYGRHTGLRTTVIYGGVRQGAQTQQLRRGVDILVATPGRLLDLINQGFISLGHVRYFVLDEADRMLDMGFIHDIKRIIAELPEERQSLFFSATLPASIVRLSRQILGDPAKITIRPEQATAEKVDQAVYFVHKKSKSKLLVHLLRYDAISSALIFSRTKHGANKIVKMLDRASIQAAAIHSNKSQGARQRALNDFKRGLTNVLVATDIAARGIDVDDLSHVINYDLPNIPETYVHRIGRTGRANASGTALSFCDREERAYLRDIQKLIDQKIPVVEEHPFLHDVPEGTPPGRDNAPRRSSQRQHHSGRHPSSDRRRNKYRSRRNSRRYHTTKKEG